MALVSCPDCANHISEVATDCPQCGRPLRKDDRIAYSGLERAKVGILNGFYFGVGVFVVLPVVLAVFGTVLYSLGLIVLSLVPSFGIPHIR